MKGFEFTNTMLAKVIVYFVNLKPPNVCPAKTTGMRNNFKHAIQLKKIIRSTSN